jgi:hypothetical protein
MLRHIPAEELQRFIRKAASALSQMQEVKPIVDRRSDVEVLPLFTSHENAEQFIKQYVRETGRFLPFGILGSTGKQHLPQIKFSPAVMLDRGSSSERLISSDQIAALTDQVTI